jgi:multidrug efflux system membrane fusion protein
VVKPDRTVAVRPVTVGVTEGDDTSIAAGLSPGELVVVEGADRLREGATVEVRRGDAPSPGRS